MNAGGEELLAGCGSNSTKVYYHLDDSATPYMSEVLVPSNLITLGDFKAVFTRKGYRYFCRRWDAELKSEVKAELVRDQQRLERSATTGLFELFLLSPALPSSSSTAAGNAGTLPRMRKYGGASVAEMPLLRPLNHHLSALALSSIVASSSNELMTVDCAGGQRVSMVTGTTASSGANTLISKRAGEHLAEPYSSTSEDPYNRTSISNSGIFLRSKPAISFGNSTGRPLLGRQKWRRQRHQKPYVPSTISSASDESSYSLPRIEEVKLRLQEAPLGISVACQDSSIFIYNIQPGSAAEKSGHLEVGDEIIQVEETRFEDLSEKQALYLLKQLKFVKKTVTMYVAKRRPLNVGGGSSSDKSDALSQFCETIQLDIGQWVESTKQFLDVPAGAKIYNNEQIIDAPHPLVSEQIQLTAAEKETSDEEQAAYLDRRAGVGPRLVPAVQKTNAKQKQQNPKRADEQANNNADVVFATTGSGGGHPSSCPAVTLAAAAVAPSVPSPLHAAMEPRVILRRMAHPRSGLDIRDRKWLKIPVPMSFIGDDMLDWLMCNVQGFKDRKCAKAFASTVLLTGHIKHVLNISVFNEKCYYIFDDSFVAERLRIVRRAAQQQQQQQQQQMDAKNEHKLASSTGAADNGNKMQRQLQPESTTEITYMSSPSSPFFGAVPPTHASQSANMGGPPQLVIVNNPKYAQCPAVLNQQRNCAVPVLNGNTAIPLRQMNMNTVLPAWPVSPIPFARPNQTPRLPRGPPAAAEVRDCESPETTNEYASMVQGEINCGAQFDVKFDGFLVPNNNNNNTIGGVIKNSPNYVNNNNNSILLLPPPPALLPAVSPVPQRQIVKHN